MKKLILSALFFFTLSLSFAQMSKEDVEYELAKFTKNTCYRFSIADMGSVRDVTAMVEENFAIKFGDRVLTITCGDSYYAIPYESIGMIQSSVASNKKDGKFTIYIN